MKLRDLNARRVGRAHGFTLIEVMAVVIIIGVIVSSVLFSIDLTGNQKTRTAISNVRLLMQGLSNEAILEGNHYGIRWDRAAQQFVPIVEVGGAWAAYSGLKSGRPNFKTVSWKGFADISMNVGGISFDERVKDDENFYAARDRDEIAGPLIEFSPTGLWEPAGEIEFFVGKKRYAKIEWTAAGRVKLEHGDES